MQATKYRIITNGIKFRIQHLKGKMRFFGDLQFWNRDRREYVPVEFDTLEGAQGFIDGSLAGAQGWRVVGEAKAGVVDEREEF